jgi:hypothetical protein
MTDLSWSVDYRFQSITRREYDWVLVFDRDVNLVVACLWRLVEKGRIRLTSLDDGQQFGLPVPLDMVDEVTQRLALASISRVELREGLLDLDIHFNTGHEAWNLSRGPQQYLAVVVEIWQFGVGKNREVN